MKKIHTFNSFINERKSAGESSGYGSALKKIANTLITTANYPRIDLNYERDNFIRKLESMGFSNDSVITPTVLFKHEDFDTLDKKIKGIIISKVGIGKKSPNNEFVKLFAKAIHEFPDFDSASDISVILNNAIAMKNAIADNTYPLYNGLPYKYYGEFRKLGFPYASELKDKLTEEEYAFIQKITKPAYEELIKKQLTDKNFEEVILFEFKDCIHTKENDDIEQFLKGISLQNDMPDFFEFIKEKILNNKKVDWKSLKVKLKYVSSKNSDVVSSSFSTYYYYDVDVDFMDKKFHKENVRLGSSHYSGGWN